MIFRALLIILCVVTASAVLAQPYPPGVPYGQQPIPATAPPLAFHSDGCSAPTPELRAIFDRAEIRSCCIVHDMEYWRGGTYAQRLTSDLELALCVVALGFPIEAELMFGAVRVFGEPRTGQPYEWGFGWQDHRAYDKEKP